MFIEPNSNIKIFNNVPLDNTYTHTLWFDSESAQKTYFSNPKHNLTNQSYQRVEKGRMRVEIVAENLYDCNYLAFQNTKFGTPKWFYAFITSIEYINNVTSEITFEIDIMQTYLFDVTLKESFVEREHSTTDNVGDNIIAEPFNFDNYFVANTGFIGTGYFDVLRPVLLSTFKIVGSQPVKAADYKGIISDNPCCLYAYTYSGSLSEAMIKLRADLFNIEESTSNAIDGIAGIYLIPASFAPVSDVREELPTHTSPLTKTFVSGKPTKLGNYTPRNKKLLTSPYNKFIIETNEGSSQEYAYEFFNSDDIQFKVYGCLTPNCSFKCVPLNYKGISENFNEVTTLSNFPMIPFSADPFKQWYAQNKTKIGIQGLTGIEKIVTGGIKQDNIEHHISNFSGDILSALGEASTYSRMPSTPRGSIDGSLEIAMNRKDFNYVNVYINEQYAEMVDDYFDMYGYATNRIKTPNRNVRPHWTYTKTNNCVAIGKCPSDDLKRICNIYDTGITFWKNANEVGNYSLNNSPT